MKRGRALGGKAPRRGGRLTRQLREPTTGPEPSLIISLAVGCLLFGLTAGFGWGMDRQLRGGILEQRREAIARPDWVPLESMPPHLPRAFLSVVDPTYEAGGPVRARDEGKTIPRELVRQIHLLGNGLSGQARELFMAPIIEQRIGRARLLELYLNRVFLGESHEYPIHGVYYAATEYFDKEPSQLTLGETAALAGLLLEPRIVRPDDFAGAVGVRRNEVLRAMLRADHITSEQYQDAVMERLAFQPGVSEIPMSRIELTASDTAVIRLPQAYRPQPPDSSAQ